MFEQNTVQEQQFVIPHHPKYEFILSNKQKIKIKTLMIGFYGPASLFTLSLINKKSPSNRVNFLKSKQTSLADIYLSQNNEIGYIVFNSQVQKMKQVYFSQFISQNFTVQRIIVFTHQYANNLQKDSNKCLQYLKTSQWKDQPNCNKYSQGLMGMSADLLIWGQIDKKPVCCYVGIFKDYQLNKQIIMQVFSSIVGKYGIQLKNDITQSIKKYNMKKYSNNLYL